MNGYNLIASFYDSLKFFVFGNKLELLEGELLNRVMDKSSILVLGGGTGSILTQLNRMGWQGNLTFVDSSNAMIVKAMERKVNFEVNFICQNERDFVHTEKVDAVITNFFLDLFDDKLNEVISRIDERMEKNGLWIVTDFRTGNKRSQKILISCMFLFFRLFTEIESKKLIVFETMEKLDNFDLIEKRTDGIISTGLFLKKH